MGSSDRGIGFPLFISFLSESRSAFSAPKLSFDYIFYLYILYTTNILTVFSLATWVDAQ